VLYTLYKSIPRGPWPDGFDAAAIVCFVALVVGAPALGYVAMAADFRAWLRSLRRALMVVSSSFPTLPGWARVDTPRSIAALGLTFPCTEDDVLRVYRRRVKKLHPDLGGDKRQFLRLQAQFEDAIRHLRERPHAYRPVVD
jgi:hypothetical protein